MHAMFSELLKSEEKKKKDAIHVSLLSTRSSIKWISGHGAEKWM